MNEMDFNASGTPSAAALNAEETIRLIPLYIFLILVAAAGISGNSMVCYVYRKSYKQSNSQFFILWLATLDLVSCCILASIEMVTVFNQYTYTNKWLCKLTIFFTFWPGLASACTLLVISIDRFRKICQPFGWQISSRVARWLCIMTVCLSLVYSWPSLFLFGIHDFPIYPEGTIGHDCAVTNEMKATIYPVIYNMLLWVTFAIGIIMLVVTYSLIARKVYAHSQKLKSVRSFGTLGNSGQGDKEADSAGIQADSSSSGEKGSGSSSSQTGNLQRKFSAVSTTSGTLYSSKATFQRQLRARKAAFVMFLISLAFVMSYLPYLILRLLEAMNERYVAKLAPGPRTVYKFFLRTYFLNCAINPFIYCAFVSKFRRECKSLLSRLFSLCTRCCYKK